MSEFTKHRDERLKRLLILFKAILEGKNVKQLFEEFKEIIDLCIPSDVIYLVDDLMKADIPMPELKTGINKMLNLLYKTIMEAPYSPPTNRVTQNMNQRLCSGCKVKSAQLTCPVYSTFSSHSFKSLRRVARYWSERK